MLVIFIAHFLFSLEIIMEFESALKLDRSLI